MLPLPRARRKKRKMKRMRFVPSHLTETVESCPHTQLKTKSRYLRVANPTIRMAKFKILLHFCSTFMSTHTGRPNSSMTKVKNLVLKRLCWLTGCLPRECAICVSLFILDTRGEWNEGNYIRNSKCRGFESPPRSVFL